MAGFRDRRIVLLVIALLLSGLFITAPWKSPAEEGSPYRHTIRGPNWGIDITGGSRILLQLDAMEAELQFPSIPQDFSEVENFRRKLEDRLQVNIEFLPGDNVLNDGRLNILIGKNISDNALASVLGDVELISNQPAEFTSPKTEEMRDRVKVNLQNRVDPYGTLGAQFKPIGSRFLLYEVSLDPENARTLLGSTGRLEIYVDNTLVLWGRDIVSVQAPREKAGQGIVLPFRLSDEGATRWKNTTEGKGGEPGVIYLDRPEDSIVLFPNSLSNSFEKADLKFNQESHSLKVADLYFLQVPFENINTVSEPVFNENFPDFIKKRRDNLSQIIYLGEESEIPNEVKENGNLAFDNIQLPYLTRPRKDESIYEWIVDGVCGVKSSPILDENLAGKYTRELNITNLGSIDEGSRLRRILEQDLPVGVSIVSQTQISGRLSEGFLREAAFAGLIAFIVVGILVYIFYRRLKIAIPLLFTMACEVVITLGAASAVPDSLMSIGLPGLGGLIAVIGTGVDHQIIIADEVLGEKFSEGGRLPIDRRTGKAFAVIFSAAATTVAAMVALAYFGFGAMRGFAIVTLAGVLISVLITRPAYAKIIGTLLEREQNKSSGGK